MTQQDPFKNIRPYRDSEVSEVLNRLLFNKEFIGAVTKYQYPSLSRWLGPVLKPVVRIALARAIGDCSSVDDVQDLVARYMNKMIARTTTKLSCSGIDELDPDGAYLFVSNHRDIAMDPAFLNWTRHHMGLDTVRIAIGDNLLSKDYVSDLMRLNKSFIVNRSAKGPREMMTALTQLSKYIEHSIQTEHSVWIAQREGRAKDGNDQTDPAILKMFYMAQRKERSFSEAIERLNIVPVSISYEYDPCDYLKANELAAKANDGNYEKGRFEDINSIVRGIMGQKGHVHVAYGTPITGEFESPEQLAAEIDRQIIDGYYLHPSNYVASGDDTQYTDADVAGFDERMALVADNAKDILRAMYANPVVNKQKQEAP